MRARHYLGMQAAAALVAFGLVWVWVAAVPLAFLDPEYPAWLAKIMMLQRCDLGDVLVVGDSRAAVDVMPSRLPVLTTNLAVGGGQAIEAFVALDKALRCARPPRRVVISFNAAHFVEPDLFWERSVRFGFVPATEVAVLLRAGEALGDGSFAAPRRDDGLAPGFRAWLVEHRFPPLYFDSLGKSGGFLRWWRNRETLGRVLNSRGQYFFGVQAGSDIAAAESHLTAFKVLPVLNWYFDRMLADLAAHHIQADFVAMPVNRATAAAVRPEVVAAFRAYLAGFEARYPGFHVVGNIIPEWPNQYFGDGFSHLNPEGAARFSDLFGRWLKERVRGEEVAFAAGAVSP